MLYLTFWLLVSSAGDIATDVLLSCVPRSLSRARRRLLPATEEPETEVTAVLR